MNDNFIEQKEKLVSLSHEINLLRQQVDYLLRNEKALGLLDLDVLMNRTHTIYDTLCSINLGDNDEDQDLEIDPEALAGLFGVTEQPEPEEEVQPEAEPEEIPQSEAEPEETLQPEPEEEIPVEPEPVQEEPVMEASQISENEQEAENPEPEKKPEGEDYGFFFRFEDVREPQETVEEKQEEPVDMPEEITEIKKEIVENQEEEPVLMEDKVVHFVKEVPEEEIPEKDLVEGSQLVEDNPFDFEMAKPETLGEKMIQDDHSLAAKFQQNPVRDLKSVIGINDKFLFVNELFGGSMEKYTKSIENLNDLKTLNGAMIYLNELKIELQWNSSNEAYKKLSDLISRKFE